MADETIDTEAIEGAEEKALDLPGAEVVDAPLELEPEPSEGADEATSTPPPDAENGIEERLEEAHRLLARQSDLVDRLHAENQELRAGELRQAQLPLVRDLLRLFDDLGRMRAAAGESGDDLGLVQAGLSDALARNGVESFAPDLRDRFDPRLHSAAGVEVTEDESLDKVVADVVREGFRWESGETIRVAEVRAYRYRDSS